MTRTVDGLAYAVAEPGSTLDTALLQQALATMLPQYMRPQHLIPLPALPLLPNGKIDRKALPPLSSTSNNRRQIAPRSPDEREIARIWQDLLHLDRVWITDNFFDLGGHSLLAMQVIARVEAQLGARVSMHALVFETLAQLAAGLKPIAATEHRETFKVPRWLGRWIRGSVH